MKSHDASDCSLPGSLEHRILLALENGPEEREAAIRQLLELHPEHADVIRKNVSMASLDGDLATNSVGASAFKMPEQIGPYRILKVLGAGGMGTVYLAEHSELRRKVALKLIRSDLLASPHSRKLFEREARAASKLDHPRICRVYEVELHGDQPYMAMEWVRGETLASRLARQKAERTARAGEDTPSANTTTRSPGQGRTDTSVPTSRQELMAIVSMVQKLAVALDVAHHAGLIHRDIKPGNIMITEDEEPMILDFGLARDEDRVDESQATSGLIGTPRYMAPEQIRPEGRKLDQRADVYSLGVVLYECLTLDPPFRGATHEELFRQILHGEVPRPSRGNKKVPSDLNVVVECAMDRDRTRRYATANAFAEDLGRIIAYEPILARRAGVPLRLRRWIQRNPAPSVAILVLLVALVALSAMYAEVNTVWASERHQLAESAHARALQFASIGQWEEALKQNRLASASGYPDKIALAFERMEAFDALREEGKRLQELDRLKALKTPGNYAGKILLYDGDSQLPGSSKDSTGMEMIRRSIPLLEAAHGVGAQADLHYARAVLTNDLSTVVHELEEALRLEKTHYLARRMMGLAFLASGQPEKALAYTDRLRMYWPHRNAADVLAYMANRLQGRKEAAEIFAERLKGSTQPEDARICGLLSSALTLLENQLEDLAKLALAQASGTRFDPHSALQQGMGLAKLSLTLGAYLRRNPTGFSDLLGGGLSVPPALLKAWSHLGPMAKPFAFALLRMQMQKARAIVDKAISEMPNDGGLGGLFNLIAAKSLLEKMGNIASASPSQLQGLVDQLDRSRVGAGALARLPALTRCQCALSIVPLLFLRKHKGFHHRPPTDPEGKRILDIVREALGTRGVSETELHAYYLLTKRTFRGAGRRIGDAILVKWQELYPASTRLPLVQAERDLEKGAWGEAREILLDFLKRHPNHVQAKALLERTNAKSK